MKLLKLIPDNTSIRFMKHRSWSFPVSLILVLVSIGLFMVNGLNLGIDFRGGTLIEIKTLDGPADISGIRDVLATLDLGDVQVQEFGSPDDVLIRIQQQDGGESAQQVVVELVRDALSENTEFRRVEVVGPRVSGELTQTGILAVVSALGAVLIYIWLRFEWQFAVGAVVATIHDVILTIGMFSILQLEFSLSSIAAVLTIVGYSLNDTVVVYDRVRENLRKYKRKSIPDVLDMAINDTLSRTALTSITTLLALIALFVFGGEVIASFTFAMIWGVIIGTYSSIFMAAPLLIFLKLRNIDTAKNSENVRVT
ncbi:MAG: protein translocase subunit SecF [Hyphomicrobiales bacterium]|nr:protein translocase subunit SecF [Hyphomicrobiales bacterium]PCJ90915.1 MAG: protein translocase subunit SecF [Hyphomicrobiales bacterium]